MHLWVRSKSEMSTPSERAQVSSRIGRAKLFLFLRRRRHELFATAVQEAVATIFRARPQGQPPVPPAQLALGTLRQVYRGVSDAEALAAVRLDRHCHWSGMASLVQRPPCAKPPWDAFGRP